MITKKELEQIKERAEKAVPGEWWFRRATITGEYLIEGGDLNNPESYFRVGGAEAFHDANFIASSRTDIPKLLETLEQAIEVIRFYTCNSPPNPKTLEHLKQYGAVSVTSVHNPTKAREFLTEFEK